MTGGSSPFVGPSTALPRVTCAVVAVASGDGLVELFGQLGVQGVVTGGQTLNPSTAELLAAVEARQREPGGRPAEQQEHHPGRRAARCADHASGHRRADRSMPDALAALVVYDPEADAASNARRDDRRRSTSVATGEVTTRRPRHHQRRRRRSSTGDWIGIVRGDGIVAISGSLDEVRPRRCSTGSSRRPARSSPIITGADATAGATPSAGRRGWVDERSVGRGRGARRRPAAVPVPVRRGVTRPRRTWQPLTLRELDEIGVDRLKGVGERKLDALQAFGIESVLDLLTFYPRRWVDRTNEARVSDLVAGREALVLVSVRSVSKRITRNRRDHGRRRSSATAAAGCTVTFFNQPWREKQLHEGLQHRAVRQARRVPRRAADDEPDRRPDRRPHRADRADLPAEREGRAEHVGDRRVRRERARAMPRARASPIRLADAVPAAARAARPRRRAAADPPARDDGGPVDGRGGARVRRAAAGADRAGDAQAGARARVSWASATTSSGELVGRLRLRRCRTS